MPPRRRQSLIVLLLVLEAADFRGRSEEPSALAPASAPPHHPAISRAFAIVTFLALGLAVANPVNSTLSRVALLSCLVLAALILGRRFPRLIKSAVIGLAALGLAIAFLPGCPVNAERLRSRHVEALIAFESAPYLWGGEGRLGIDCSGLPRRALRSALLTEGALTLNPALIRQALNHWWHDASARALAEGYRDYAFPLGIEGTIQKLDPSSLLPGNLAITRDGIHVVVYLGGHRWIQADPGAQKVVIQNSRTESNAWFHAPVQLYRWRLLAR